MYQICCLGETTKSPNKEIFRDYQDKLQNLVEQNFVLEGVGTRGSSLWISKCTENKLANPPFTGENVREHFWQLDDEDGTFKERINLLD